MLDVPEPNVERRNNGVCFSLFDDDAAPKRPPPKLLPRLKMGVMKNQEDEPTLPPPPTRVKRQQITARTPLPARTPAPALTPPLARTPPPPRAPPPARASPPAAAGVDGKSDVVRNIEAMEEKRVRVTLSSSG